MQRGMAFHLMCGLVLSGSMAVLAAGQEPSAQEQAFPALAEAPASLASPSASQTVITPDELSAAVERYIGREAEIQNGHFLFFDKNSNQPLALTYQGVDKSQIQRQSENQYLAVARMETQEKQIVLLDIIMKYMGNDQLKVTEVRRHQEPESPSEYQWDEAAKNWRKM